MECNDCLAIKNQIKEMKNKSSVGKWFQFFCQTGTLSSELPLMNQEQLPMDSRRIFHIILSKQKNQVLGRFTSGVFITITFNCCDMIVLWSTKLLISFAVTFWKFFACVTLNSYDIIRNINVILKNQSLSPHF